MSDPDGRSRYQVTAGIDRDSLPWRLWMKAKKNFWDPADIDFSRDRADWESMPEEVRVGVAIGARGFMVGEEAVTLDILPLVRAISDEGRLEETIFLTSFALEEAKHVDFFRTWFDAVGFDPRTAPQVGGYSQGGADIFAGELQRVMTRLDDDRSPEAFLDCGITYNQFIEGVAAIAGYKGWTKFFQANDVLPGLQQGLQLVQKDERRHIAYGTYLCRRIIAAHPELWTFVERRWAELTEPFLESGVQGRGRYVRALIARRLQVMSEARNQTVSDVEDTTLEDLEASTELTPVSP